MNSRWLLILLVVLIVVLRVTCPNEFFSSDQLKQVGYIMDILHGGDLSIQYEVDGPIATKPPLYNWISAAFAWVTGSTAPWVMMLPSLLAAFGLLAIVYALGAQLLNPYAAFWAVLTMGSSYIFFKLMWFARTDMLMTFGVFLAIYLVYQMPASWTKPVAIGAVLAADFLVKGPIGPPLFLLWFAWWAFHEGTLSNTGAYPKVIVGAIIPLVIAGIWLALVWNKPQFQESVVHAEFLDRITGNDDSSSHVFGYVPVLFGRTAPWCLVAIIAVFAARKQPEWRTIRFLAIWALLVFVVFSAISSKRGDRLLPMLPPVFLLAGYGMDYLVRRSPGVTRRIALCLSVIFMSAPVVLPFASPRSPIPSAIWILTGCVSVCGVIAVVLARRSQIAPAVCAIAVAYAFLLALDRHNVLKSRSSATEYAKLRTFVERFRADAEAGKVLVWDSETMISYELGLHQRNADPSQLAGGQFEWFICRSDNFPELREQIPCDLTEIDHLSMHRHRGEISAYRVQCGALETIPN